ncbi:MAG TPA: hypothetical protein VJP77_03435, partial [Planctomycetota bacterium]|nr:hypothetical protein [Planctomycetota bacterium]
PRTGAGPGPARLTFPADPADRSGVAPDPADPSGLTSVCLALGPYRNLTTLTAGILALHPRCQVLNHAGVRLLPDPDRNFLAAYTPARMAAFLREALELSAGGERGQRGGSITKSHAFDAEHPLGRLYRARYGGELAKSEPTCLFWKESLHTSNFLRRRRVDVGALLAADRRLRFLMPVRRPLDCALSNVKTEHTRYFEDLPTGAGVPEVLDAVLDHLRWTADLAAAHPDRVFLFTERRFDRDALLALARFLELEPEPRWLADALAAYRLTPGYAHPPEHVALYERLVRDRFAAHPALQVELLELAA